MAAEGVAMTTERLVRALLTRWYVVGVGLALTIGCMMHVHAQRGLYYAQIDVVVVAPATAHDPNTIEANASGLTSIAGMVAAEVNKTSNTPATASAGATLAGQGVRDGYEVRLPSDGGQWAQNFDRPVLDVQAIGPTPASVRARVVHVLDQIDTTLRELQAADGVPAEDRVTTLSAPAAAQILYLGGTPARAAIVTGLLGLWLTVIAAVLADGALRRRRAAVRAVDPLTAV